MDTTLARSTPAKVESIGRVATVNGSQSSVEINARAGAGEYPTVGKFMGLLTGKCVIIGLITEVGEDALSVAGGGQTFRKVARLDLIGELRADAAGSARFQRGVTEYPNIGDGAFMLTEAELRLVYGSADADRAHIGNLQQNTNIHVHINIDHLVDRKSTRLNSSHSDRSRMPSSA